MKLGSSLGITPKPDHKMRRLSLLALSLFTLAGCSHIEQRFSGFINSGEPVLADTRVDHTEQDTPAIPSEALEEIVLEPRDMLSRISGEFSWSIQADSPQISYWTDYFRNRPDEFSTLLARGEPYLYFIAGEISERSLPMELALLPLVESGFNPKARSSSGAAGLWQFMPATGRSLGLTQNWWVDERLSVVGSTKSALDYLEYLHGRFGDDWLLALAAYNTGEGNVSKELRQSGSEADFWSLHLNSETRNYVPKLLAVVEILSNAEAYDFELPAWLDFPYFTEIEVANQLDMRKLDSVSDDMGLLNSQFVQSISFPQQGSAILVPIRDKRNLDQQLASHRDQLIVQYSRYQVRNGDSLSVIADRHRVNLGALMSLNGLSGHLIHPGDNLLIPISRYSQTQVAEADPGYLRIKVRSGDSLSVIAERYEMRLNELVRLNHLSSVNSIIYPDQELLVQIPAAEGDPLLYRVASGDSLSVIANRFNIMLEDLLTWNGLHGREVIYPGQQLAIWTN